MNNGFPLLQIRDVDKSYSGAIGVIPVLRRINFSLNEGEFVAVTGPSGSGKSTLLNLIALLDRPTAGRIEFDGINVGLLSESTLCRLRGEKIGMVFQRFCLLPHRNVLENVLFRFRYLPHKREKAREAALHGLNEVGLANKVQQPVRLLSIGEMQRVAIARAVAHRPRILLADEPTGNLDRKTTMEVMECFAGLNRQGITILLVTHNEELLGFCSRHMVLREGKLD